MVPGMPGFVEAYGANYSQRQQDIFRYAEAINANNGKNFWSKMPHVKTRADKREIRDSAIKQGLIFESFEGMVTSGRNQGMYEGSGQVSAVGILPRHMWGKPKSEQFDWLNKRLGFEVNQRGYTWDHRNITPGGIEGVLYLVPMGSHRVNGHTGPGSGRRWDTRSQTGMAYPQAVPYNAPVPAARGANMREHHR